MLEETKEVTVLILQAYENLLNCRGKYARCFKNFDLDELRKDRGEE